MKTRAPGVALVLALLALPAPRALGQDAPAHPRELRFPELVFEPPSPANHRHVLANGLVAYLVPDASIPALRVRAYVRAGSLYDPEGKEGLAALTLASLRSGGAGDLKPEELDSRLDETAASIDADCQEARASVEVWTRARHRDALLALFADVLRRPRFDEERLRRTLEDTAAEAQNDEDDAAVVAKRRMRRALYGDHPIARHRTPASLVAITREDVVSFHREFVTPGRVVLAVSGAFEPAAMKKRLEELFGDWTPGEKGWKPVPEPAPCDALPVVVVDRPDNAQSYVEVARLGIGVGHPDEPALTIADHVFGSGSFTSRVAARVRGDEGLAYSVGSDFDEMPVLAGIVRTYFQSQASETSYALKLVVDEARRLAAAGPTPDELAGAKAAVLGRFPARFATATDSARALAEADLDGLPADHHATFRRRISAVTAEGVKAAAARYFGPRGAAIVVVGPAESARRSVLRGTALDDLGRVRVDSPR